MRNLNALHGNALPGRTAKKMPKLRKTNLNFVGGNGGDDGRDNGFDYGHDNGRDNGRDHGRDNGRDGGHGDGRDDGRDDGCDDGRGNEFGGCFYLRDNGRDNDFQVCVCVSFFSFVSLCKSNN